ncbi:MAG: PSD1 and planctomycete cytochrome C domain-containing protein [Planctomycetaceae bacterium]
MSSRHPTRSLKCLAIVLACTSPVDAADVLPTEHNDDFETHIRPLLATRCYACHSSSTGKQEGGLLLDSRNGWFQGGVHGPAVIPGDVEASLLIRAVRYSDPELQMPPDQALPAAAIAALEQWVRSGAPDPRSGAAGLEFRADPSDPVAGRTHWAFQPLAEPKLPIVETAQWPRSRLDMFVLSRLEAAGLQPAPDADRLALARRVCFQLIGLPPTPQQVESFVNDARPDAYERMVDLLLSSPHFGERWGRHWLDLARYADSNGLDENFLFREAWRYRNGVIEAVNADLAFDRFVQEQLAGDLLPHDSLEQRDRQRIAAGFLVMGPKVLLGNDAKNQRMEVADEQLDTIGRAILGQTLGCARCHDHKFDPIPTADYYAMAGILTSTQVMQQRYMLGQQRVMERLAGLSSDGDALNDAYESYWREYPQVKQRKEHAESALKLLEQGNQQAWEAFTEMHANAIAEGAAETSHPREERIGFQRALIAELGSTIDNPPEIPARAMIPCDVDEPGDESVRLAGQFDRPGEKVPRGFLRVLGESPAAIPAGRSGRIELARWLTDPHRGAGQLTARVLANRIWHHLIGRGIVRTVDNFGRTGESASHPELLDFLAGELIKSGWSIKHLVREIALSRTFIMSSRHDAAGYALDPENLLLWRAHRRRLDPESLRDAMLCASGELDPAPMGSTVWYLGDQATAVGDNRNRRRTDFPCRSVYLPVIRNDLPELFAVFDFADPQTATGARPDTMVAMQGLYFLNADSVMAAAAATARRVIAESPERDPRSTADRIFELVLGQSAAEADVRDVLTFLDDVQPRFVAAGDADPQLRAWSMVCHALFASSRFQLLE